MGKLVLEPRITLTVLGLITAASPVIDAQTPGTRNPQPAIGAAALADWIEHGRLGVSLERLTAAEDLAAATTALEAPKGFGADALNPKVPRTPSNAALRAAQLLWRYSKSEPQAAADLIARAAATWKRHVPALHVTMLLEIESRHPGTLAKLETRLRSVLLVPTEEGKQTQVPDGPRITLRSRGGRVHSIQITGLLRPNTPPILGMNMNRALHRLPLDKAGIERLATLSNDLEELAHASNSLSPVERECAARHLDRFDEQGVARLRSLLRKERERPVKPFWWLDDDTVLCFGEGRSSAVIETAEDHLFRIDPTEDLLHAALPRLATTSFDRELRLRAIQQLGLARLSGKEAITALLRCLTDEDSRVVRAALNAAAMLPEHSEPIADAIRKLGDSNDERIARHAQRVLGLLKKDR